MLPLILEIAVLASTTILAAPPPPRTDPPGCKRVAQAIVTEHAQLCRYPDHTLGPCRETMTEHVLVCPGKPPQQIGVDIPSMRGRVAKSSADSIEDMRKYREAHPEEFR